MQLHRLCFPPAIRRRNLRRESCFHNLNGYAWWCSIVVRKLLKRASFTSVEDLQARVLAFVEYFNTTMAKPFQWTYGQKPLHV